MLSIKNYLINGSAHYREQYFEEFKHKSSKNVDNILSYHVDMEKSYALRKTRTLFETKKME